VQNLLFLIIYRVGGVAYMQIQEMLLTKNPYSRPGKEIREVKGIVIHWVANPNSTAQANRNFFENRKSGKIGYGSAHYIIDLDGTVILAIPPTEMAYHVGAKQYKEGAIKRLGDYPNSTTLGIECTHMDWKGTMTQSTYEKLIHLTIDLCKTYKLNPLTDLYRHYDITGKICHKWFVDHLDEWQKFKKTVNEKLKEERKEKPMVQFDLLGKKVKIEGMVEKGRTYVAAKDLLEQLGYRIGWKKDTKTIIVRKGKK
jgi:N-acetylmuramoyl-L-alanine amidase